ncbi:MAG: hypothetical protein MZW92_42445 [Comamonadaceae bacterium]|nr:hypothetical protein [Comamonadaceae bacterium]
MARNIRFDGFEVDLEAGRSLQARACAIRLREQSFQVLARAARARRRGGHARGPAPAPLARRCLRRLREQPERGGRPGCARRSATRRSSPASSKRCPSAATASSGPCRTPRRRRARAGAGCGAAVAPRRRPRGARDAVGARGEAGRGRLWRGLAGAATGG